VRKKKAKSKRRVIKVPAAKRRHMFDVWCETESIKQVSNKCTVHWKTAERYYEIDNWQERLEDIQAQARTKDDQKRARDRANIIERYSSIRDAGLNNLLSQIKEQIDLGEAAPTLKLGVKDLDKLERLLKFLEGKPDSRPDTPDDTIQRENNERVTDALVGIEKALGSKAMQKLADKLASEL
jgi:hypothetical protein